MTNFEQKYKDRMEKDRQRQERYRERQKEAGKKTLTVLISKQVQEIIEAEKKATGETTEQVVDRIFTSYPKTKTEKFLDEVKELHEGQKITPSLVDLDDANKIIVSMRDSGDTYREIAAYLNGREISTEKGKKWTPDNVRMRFYALTK